MVRVIDKHAVHALLRAGLSTREIASQFSASQRTVQRMAKEPPVDEAVEPQGPATRLPLTRYDRHGEIASVP